MSLASKLKGNEHFKNKAYLFAIDEYTRAIKIFDNDPIYYSNRALCFNILEKYEEALVDANMSAKLDSKNYKAYNIKGIALLEMGKKEESKQKMEEGLRSLQTCLIIVKEGSDKKIVAEIETKVDKAKKIIYLKQKEISKERQESTKAFVNQMISKVQDKSEDQKIQLKDLMNNFIKEGVDYQTKEIPEALTCKITFEMMKEPIISSSGISYEKNTLLEHLDRVGRFDPSTRQPMLANSIVPNKQLSKAIQEYKTKNPWSFEFISPNEDYHKIVL